MIFSVYGNWIWFIYDKVLFERTNKSIKVMLYKPQYCDNLHGSCCWESMRSPFNDEKFIYRRNFWVKRAPLAEVIYDYGVHIQHSTAVSKENQTQRYYLT